MCKAITLFAFVPFLYGCASNQGYEDIIELEYTETPRGNCEMLELVSTKGFSQEETIVDIKKRALEIGGNSVFFHGGHFEIDSETKEIQSFTNGAMIFLCR